MSTIIMEWSYHTEILSLRTGDGAQWWKFLNKIIRCWILFKSIEVIEFRLSIKLSRKTCTLKLINLLKEPLNYDHCMKLHQCKPKFQLRNVRFSSYLLTLLYEMTLRIREIRNRTQGRRCGTFVQVVLSAKKMILQIRVNICLTGNMMDAMVKYYS
jgi:hypothetical protein